MISAIVFLPLVGFLVAGLITLVGRRMMIEAEPAPAGHGAHGHGQHDHRPGHGAATAAHHPSDDHGHADDHGHGQDHHAPEAPGARFAEVLTTGLVMIAAVLSWVVLVQVGFGGAEYRVTLMRFIHVGSFVADWTLRVDTLTAVMLVVVNSVSALVHLYSIGYMSHDEHRPRFFAYLSLFTFAMLTLVTADNFVQLFFGWEGVGLASYLLIGFWFKKDTANAASMKAFIVNRVGDFGFALGIFGVFALFGSVSFDTVFAGAQGAVGRTMPFLGYQVDALTVVSLLLFVGAMGKSAQFLLHTWLPDAMEGPTPVSALIHAATMVTAGVFMVARLSPLFEYAPNALAVVTVIGAITAFFAATVGLVQNDIKRVIAYSTCSQLGYMFAAIGVGAYPIAMFHLFTHAFFKALLFLGSGSVIHAVGGEQDIRKMGGLATKIPFTYWMMVVGTLALTGVGIPFTFLGFAGFFSKDAIIEATFAAHSGVGGFAFLMLVVSALMTSFYSWRLIFKVFHGPSHLTAEQEAHVHESPLTMTVPLGALAVGAVLSGAAFYKVFADEHGVQSFFRTSLHAASSNHILHGLHEVPWAVPLSPFVAMLVGFAIAWLFYVRRPELPEQLARSQDILYRFLLNKWYFDELYDIAFVRPARALGRLLWKGGDQRVIDGFGPNGIAARVVDITRGVVRLQTGYLYHYAFVMLLGIAALITWYMFTGAAR
jgi:NADH-quinone oxidoreductase subunit L